MNEKIVCKFYNLDEEFPNEPDRLKEFEREMSLYGKNHENVIKIYGGCLLYRKKK